MKKTFLLFAFIGLVLCVTAQEEYYIEGFYQRHGEGKYTLTDVHTQGITMQGKNDFPERVFPGIKQENIKCKKLNANLIQFSFDEVVTECKEWQNLRFQYWDYDNVKDSIKWKDDVEACMIGGMGYSQKDIVLMLVLDYSSSMSKNTQKLKTMSINFIKSISEASPKGNVHVGIIAFAGMDKATNQIFPITPLTESNQSAFENFIKGSSQGTETAMYYSIDNAMKMTEDYIARKNIIPENFNGSFMITFTDGLDNASINDNISPSMHRGSKNEYLAHLSPLLQWGGKKILGKPLEHFAVGFTGSEHFTEDDMILFKNVLQKLTPDSLHFILADQFGKVEGFFNYIITSLTTRWQTLDVYVGEAQYGRVRWVLECGDAPKVEKQKKPKPDFLRLPLLGLNVGFGGGYSKPTQFLEGSFGLDFAVACTPKFALGLYGSYKTSFITFHQGAIGLNFMIGPQQKAFLLGLGCNLMDRYSTSFNASGYHIERYCYFNAGGDIRLGGVFKGFYFFFDFAIGPYDGRDTINNERYDWYTVLPQATFNIGINFMQLGKKNKNNTKK